MRLQLRIPNVLLCLLFLSAMTGHGIAQEKLSIDPAVEAPQPATGEQSKLSDSYTSTVGFPSTIRQIVLSGPELKEKPITNRDQPIVVRVIESWPHGSDFRYDIEFYGLEPGNYNLAEYLVTMDGQPVENLSRIEVTVDPILPAGQVVPHAVMSEKSFFGSYYIPILVAAGTIWLVGLFLILFAGRSKAYRAHAQAKVVTVADRLKPLIDKAMMGELHEGEKAELERVLDAFWRKRLGLKALPAHQLRSRMRNHPDASRMLSQMDQWLHAPDPATDIDVKNLLEPYQTMNLDEL